MQNSEDLYAILQVQPSAHPDVIESAYRRLLRVYHPDVNPSPEAHRITVLLNHAYSVLSDPEKRSAYDREQQELAHQHRQTGRQGREPRLDDLLLQAADQGNTDLVRTLISRGANVNARDEWDLTPLHRAAHRRHIETARVLLSEGANFNARDRWERTPLEAVPERYPQARFDLADATARVERERRTHARRDQSRRRQSRRQEESSQASQRGRRGLRASHGRGLTDDKHGTSSESDHIDSRAEGDDHIWQQRSSSRSSSDGNAYKILFIGLGLTFILAIAVAVFLLRIGDIERQEPSYISETRTREESTGSASPTVPLKDASNEAQPEQEGQAQAEQERQAQEEQERQAQAERDRQAQEEQERQAQAERDRQAQEEQERQAQAEQERQAQAERRLFEASSEGDAEAVLDLIINQGTRVNISDSNGNTPLHLAAYQGHTETAKALLSAGAYTEARAVAGITPLHAAAHWGHTEVVFVLLTAGADVNTRDDNGLSALDHTEFKEQTETGRAIKFALANSNFNAGLFSDWEALLDAREQLAGDAFLNWQVDANMRDWDGVTIVASQNRVTRLALSDRGLNGQIPPELGRLIQLEELMLDVNELNGEIPPELGNLPNLQRIDFGHNRLNGTIPAELGNLSNLRFLKLAVNNLTGRIPPEFGSLNSMETMWLSSNQLSGEISPELGRLDSLRILWLSENQISGEIPTELADIPNLEVLHLVGNQLHGCIPFRLQKVREGDLSSLGLEFCASGN